MSNQLAIRGPMEIDIQSLGKILAQSGYFQDAREAGQAIVKVLAGQELGFGPIASMTGVNIIKGRVALSANLMAAAIKRSGRYTYRVIKHDDTICELAFFEGGQEIGRSSFSAAEAKRAGTQNMDKFPRNMLFARALSNGAKWHCPDIFGGPVYTPDELGARVDAEGEIIEVPAPQMGATFTPQPEPPAAAPVKIVAQRGKPVQVAAVAPNREGMINRIQELWRQEGQDVPANEIALDLDELGDDELLALGRRIRARIEAAAKQPAQAAA